MTHIRLTWLAAVLAMGGGTTTVLAQYAPKDAIKDLPSWKIPEICAKDSARDHCLALESRAWRAVSGSWVSLPDLVKTKCLADTKAPTESSWRVLNDCVDEEMERATDNRAVQTLKTPAEAVPAAKPVAAVAVVPSPPAAAPPPVAVTIAPTPPVAPASTPTPIAVAVPPPILGMPTAPPPFALDLEVEIKRRAEAEAEAAAEATRKATVEAEAKRLAEAENAQRAAANAEAKRLADAEAARKAAADAAAKVCQESLQAISRAGVIRFDFASYGLANQSLPTLNDLVASMKACPGNLVIVEGHTDSTGDPENNLALSKNRAQAVVNYIVNAGLPAVLLKAEGFGASKPLADNATQAGRAQNRRIEFKVEAQ